VLTTHYLDEAQALADRVAVIADGRIVDSGTPDSLGGRQQAPVTVTWLDEQGPRRVHTHRPTSVVLELAGRYTGEVPGLTVARPSLEDVYLTMIGATQIGAAFRQYFAAGIIATGIMSVTWELGRIARRARRLASR
jgi:ABC-2 type transport system ATP-binding protein